MKNLRWLTFPQKAHQTQTPQDASSSAPSVEFKALPLEELMPSLLGKAPLRRITDRTHLFELCWLEKLECGHEVQTFQQFGADGQKIPITAKRRRCTKCKPPSPISERERLSLKADRIWAGIVEYRKWYYGSRYDQFFDEEGCARRDAPPVIGAVAKHHLPAPFSPKKGVQSVSLDEQQRTRKGVMRLKGKFVP
jgi:hypothetical protein